MQEAKRPSRGLKILKEKGLMSAIYYKLRKKGFTAAYKNEGLLGLLVTMINRKQSWYYRLENPCWRENLWVRPWWTQFLSLPQGYSYISVGSHGVGYAAWLELCKLCGLNPMDLSVYHRIDFARYYRKIHEKQNGAFFGLTLDRSYLDSRREKIMSRLQKRVPVFCLVRDPISVLKSHANGFFLPVLNTGGGGGGQAANPPSYEDLPDPLWVEKNKQRCINDCCLFVIYLHVKWTKTRSHFCYTSAPAQIQAATSQLHYIDMQELATASKSFATFQRVCAILKRPIPQNLDLFDINFSKASFLSYGFPWSRDFDGLDVPIIYDHYPHGRDGKAVELGSVRIVDSKPHGGRTSYLKSKNQANDYVMSYGLAREDADKLERILCDSSLMHSIEEYALEYHARLAVREEFCKSHRISEEEILEFLGEHKDYLATLRERLSYEVSGVLKARPDIVDSWKYYRAFEKLCEEKL